MDQTKIDKLMRFSQAMKDFGAMQSGDPKRMALVQERQRRTAENEAEKEKLQNNYTTLYGFYYSKTKDPQRAKQLADLHMQTGGASIAASEIKAKSKNDYVTEILDKIEKDENYVLTKADQRILDTIADTDPLKIRMRNMINEMENNLPTVTTEEEFDALPSGAEFLEDGILYRKP